MKKTACVLLALLTVVSLMGCGGSVRENSAAEVPQEEAEESIDVDLTKLSKTMIYSEVYNMLTVPEDYLGKKVRIWGNFALLRMLDENNEPIPDQYYYACVIADATACCQQGMEFVLTDDYQYPEDYPKPGSLMTVVGEFRTYTEGENQYCHLVNARLE